ncbi:MAG TPA: bifunctional (p)ppGpp synthetase/guanosine-3',5'-bis(diphosphate) 3'-pyrophosphohydrolase [Candidatus Limnocylindrales bacterium]|jgi:GTP pyrophosphokinase|nr:bifunctional (p)ppGpp synthetase/guanosine-3',5'-bis(diphosphate) 3'-pyrophosphohydrolase [Candidatus Limnocylindrales bacterium]
MAASRTKTTATASAASATSAERAVAPARHATPATVPSGQAKKPTKTPARRGPRRPPAVRPGGPGEIDLEALRTALKASIAEHHPTADLGGVDRAFDLAVDAHQGQPRATGEPYVTHPIASAQIVADLGIDPVAVEAALLHDVPEDTEYSLTDIEERFGAEVAHLVDGVTKLSRFSTHSHEQQQAENIRKMLLAMAEDIRVVLIKLADRLHNMRTLYGLASEKQSRIARQTMEIYAPLAERLGIWQIKWELEDLAFKVLEPERFRELARLLDTRRKGRESYIDRAIAELRPKLEAAGIEPDLQGRPKHIFSIWKKMQRKGAEFGEIYDVYAIRVLVDEVRDCYAALGIVHSLWRPIPGQFDDYIAVPKNNLYQSLHTAVIALDGKPLEIQIRTHQMHQVSEVGIAAHWRYKEGTKSDREYDAKLAWLRQLMDWQRDVSESDATEFVEGIKLDIFQDQVFVFTPKGDIKDLPAGATPLDFAYRIHTDVGHRTIGAKVNNRLVPLDYRLKNGDIVEIVTTKGEHGPSRDWLNVVRTSHAREKIRQWFKRKDRDENIVHGRESLERELRRLARTTIAVVGTDKIAEVAKQLNHESVDDFFAAIGYGAIGPQAVVMRLGVVDDGQAQLPTVAPSQQVARTGGVRVKGVGDLLVRFAKCCHPIPGDPIVGFITRGKGVTVHLRSCPTVANEREVTRLIEVEWEAEPTQTYPIAIRVEAFDRTGLLNDITQVVAENKVNIVAANVGVSQDHTAIVTATLQVASVSQLARVMSRIENLKDVISVTRDLG